MSVQKKYTKTCKRLDAILAALIKDWHIFGTRQFKTEVDNKGKHEDIELVIDGWYIILK